MKAPKKVWSSPTLKRLPLTDELLELLASVAHDSADIPVKRVK